MQCSLQKILIIEYMNIYTELPTVAKQICSLKFTTWEKRYQFMFQLVGAYFQVRTVGKGLLWMPGLVDRVHEGFLNDELGPENENTLKFGKVTWGHEHLIFCLKFTRYIFKLALRFFHLCEYKSVLEISSKYWKHEILIICLQNWCITNFTRMPQKPCCNQSLGGFGHHGKEARNA